MNRAPTLNRAAIGPQGATGPGPSQRPDEDREQVERKRANRKRVEGAVEFGAALEDLAAYVYLVAHDRLQRDESENGSSVPEVAPRALVPRFPPDLVIQLAPKAHLQRTRQKLRKLGPLVLSPEQPDGAEQREQNQQIRQQQTQQRKTNGAAGGMNPDGPRQPWPGDGQQEPNGAEQQPSAEEMHGPPSRTNETEEQAQQEQAQQEQAQQGQAQQEQAQQGQAQQQEPNGTEQQPGSEEVRQAQRRQAQQQRQRQLGLNGGPSRPGSSKQFIRIEQCINKLLPANGVPCADQDLPLSSFGDLYWEICQWNEHIVEHLVDTPEVLSAYRVGKALSYTRWQIRRADERWNLSEGVSSTDPWNEAFDKQRVDEIQRHANVLNSVLDPRAVAAVVTGLGYWRSSLLYLTSLRPSNTSRLRSWWSGAFGRLASLGEPTSARSRQPHKEQAIEIPRTDRDELMKALEEQVENWLDVMTEQRPPESFPVAGIVTSLTKKAAANVWAKLFRFLVPALIVLVVVGALGAGVLLVLDAVSPDTWSRLENINWKALLGGLGTALVAVFTSLFAPRGQSLFGRGAGGATNGAGGRVGEAPRGGVTFRDNYGVGRAIVSGAASLKQDAFSEVVEQLRLEELNLAVSDPLVRCVLALRDQETGNPQKDAERFLQLVYKNESNLKRLQPVFKDLYKY